MRAEANIHECAWDFARMRDAPWSESLRDLLALYADCRDWPTLEDHNRRLAHLHLTNASGAPLRFANVERRRTRRKAPARVDLASTYDGQVAYNAIVPTREKNVHDFFNVMSWAAFPKTKRRINAMQVAALTQRIGREAERVPNARSREEDFLTMLDEGGLVEGARSFVLGHALLEHFYRNEMDVRAFCIRLDAGENERARIDELLAEKLNDGVLSLLER